MLSAALAPGQQARAQGVTVALRPSSTTVAPGSTFSVYVEVTQAGSPFNGFDAIIGYDPNALTLVPLSPLSQQEGSYMKSACGSRFHRFQQGADRDTATDVLLCNSVSLTGPGRIYQLQFRASSTAQFTKLSFMPGLRFYSDGLVLSPVNSCDAIIAIGMAAGIDDALPTGLPLRLRAAPNPARSRTSLTIEAPGAGDQELRIYDVTGRTVRQLESGFFGGGVRRVTWDGRSDSGALLPPGIYLARLWAAGRWVDERVALLH